MTRRRAVFTPGIRRQRGLALLVLLTLVILVASYALLKQLNREKPEILRAGDNAAVLAEAKAALTGYALASTTDPLQALSPGQLPCPDYGVGPAGLDGISDPCLENGTYVTLGRLPWKTLGLSDLRDADGEALWYAPAIEFDGNTAINSTTTSPFLRVVTNNTQEIVAVIIAPGEPTSTQSRPQNIAAQTTPSRYLEASNAVADPNISVVAPTPTTEFNDQVQVITRDALMPAVERVVLEKLKNALPTPYPAAAPVDTTDCIAGTTEGLLPLNCPATTPVSWPAWFTANNWQPLIWYANDTAGPFEVINGPGPGVQTLLVAVGRVLSVNTARTPPTPRDSLLEGTNAVDDMKFEVLSVDATSNDQILVVAP